MQNPILSSYTPSSHSANLNFLLSLSLTLTLPPPPLLPPLIPHTLLLPHQRPLNPKHALPSPPPIHPALKIANLDRQHTLDTLALAIHPRPALVCES